MSYVLSVFLLATQTTFIQSGWLALPQQLFSSTLFLVSYVAETRKHRVDMIKSTVSQDIRVNQWPKTKHTHTHNPKDESINWLAKLSILLVYTF